MQRPIHEQAFSYAAGRVLNSADVWGFVLSEYPQVLVNLFDIRFRVRSEGPWGVPQSGG